MTNTLKYALAAFALSVIWKIGIFILGYQHADIGKFSFLIPVAIPILLIQLICIVYSNQLFKEGLQSTGDIFKSILQPVLLFSAIYAIFIFIYYKFIDVHFFEIKMQENLKIIENFPEATPEKVAKYKENSSFFLNPGKQAFFTFTTFSLISMISSVIFAFMTAVLRKRS